MREEAVLRARDAKMGSQPEHICVIGRDVGELFFNRLLAHSLRRLKFSRPIVMHFPVAIREREPSGTGVVGGWKIRNLAHGQEEKEFTIVNAVIPFINKDERHAG